MLHVAKVWHCKAVVNLLPGISQVSYTGSNTSLLPFPGLQAHKACIHKLNSVEKGREWWQQGREKKAGMVRQNWGEFSCTGIQAGVHGRHVTTPHVQQKACTGVMIQTE